MSDLEFENDSDYLTTSSDEEDFEVTMGFPRTKNDGYLADTVPQYDDETFKDHFRLAREHVSTIADRYENHDSYKPQTGQYGKLSALEQVLIFLWYLGHQTSSFRDVADRFDISISCLHRIISRLAVFISNLSSEIITWPDDNEKKLIEQHIRGKGFPSVIGAIDGTHIRIDKPQNDSDSYLNRKGYYSIQMQIVCDHKLKIRNAFIGYPGSVHDARVFRQSPLCANLEERCGVQYTLLGDSAYPLRANLLVPFKDRGNLSQRQINYNILLSKNRYVIEHCFGVLKQKFRQLFHLKLRRISNIVHLIRAACVLHNISVDDGFVTDETCVPQNVDSNLQNVEEVGDDHLEDSDGRRVRDHFVNTLRPVRYN